MPTLASVTPPVPPMMIISAGMLMNEAGLVPSIIELSRSAPNAHPIPIAVDAFIATLIGCGKKILESWLDQLVPHCRERRAIAVGRRRTGLTLSASARERVAEHLGAIRAHSRGDLLGCLRHDDLRAGGECDHRVGSGLDRHDHV